MKCSCFATIHLLALLLLYGTNAAGQNGADTPQATYSNVTYNSTAPYCLLDIYLTPEATGNTPAIIAVKGPSGRNSDDIQQVLRALPYGYSVVVPALGDSVMPAIRDVVSVVKWIKENGRRYRLDPQKIILWGCSQGGYIAAMAGCAGTYLQGFESEMEFYSPDQMAAAQKSEQQLQRAAESFGICTTGNAVKVQAVVDIRGLIMVEESRLTPQMFITPQTPPFFMIYDKKNTAVPFETADSFASGLRNAIGEELVEYILLPEANRDDIFSENQQLFPQIFVFLDRILHINR